MWWWWCGEVRVVWEGEGVVRVVVVWEGGGVVRVVWEGEGVERWWCGEGGVGR